MNNEPSDNAEQTEQNRIEHTSDQCEVSVTHKSNGITVYVDDVLKFLQSRNNKPELVTKG
jgi:hypothetical protein